MTRLVGCAAALSIGFAIAAQAWAQDDQQQVSDTAADVSVAQPAFDKDRGPLIAVDAAHHNFHTADNRFSPFAALLRNDGFRVSASSEPLSTAALRGFKVLVIANALNAVNDNHWVAPTPSAFEPAEIAAFKAWVDAGGSALIIADHFPFAGAVGSLAAAFGFTFINGFALHYPDVRTSDLFTRADGTLSDDIITRGRQGDPPITQIATFTGSAFKPPASARQLIVLPKDFVMIMTPVAWQFTKDTPMYDIAGLVQGAVMPEGKGRLAVFSEAGMFTAQIVPGNPPARFGFNAPEAPENKQFILNLMHWLAGLLPE